MLITRTEKYQKELLVILKYIANDKITANRKSIYFDDENVRDMIFKKYTINKT